MACNLPSLDAFESQTAPGGVIFVNRSLIERKVARQDVQAIYIPAAEMADQIGVRVVLNVILLAAYAALSGVITVETLRTTIRATLKRQQAVEANMKAVDEGARYIREHYPKAVNPQIIEARP